MIKNTLIIALVIVIVYLYYQQNKKTNFSTKITGFDNELDELKKRLDKLIEENEDYETEVDTLTRAKNSLEQDLTAQSNSYQSRFREKDQEIKKLKKDLELLPEVQKNLTSEKQQHKGSLERIKLLTEQISKLEKEIEELKRSKSPMPGEFPESEKAELLNKITELEAKIERLEQLD